MDKASKLYEIANNLASNTPRFFETQGHGVGNHLTNNFINKLGELAQKEFKEDYSEKKICGNNNLAVDFYFPEDGTIVEIALGLKNPSTEYEKDILKAVMAQSHGCNVSKLLFISKPGGRKKCNQPSRKSVKEWLIKTHKINIVVNDLDSI